MGSFRTCLGSLDEKESQIQEAKKQSRPPKGPQWASRDQRTREEEQDSGRAVRKAPEGEKHSEQSTGEERQETSRSGRSTVHAVSAS